MIAIELSKVAGLIKVNNKKITSQVLAAKKKLQRLELATVSAEKKAYIQQLVNLKEKIVTATPSEITTYMAVFDGIYELFAYGNTVKQNEEDKTFKEELLKALGYAKLRSTFYPKYFRALGVKCCVYCNSQLCVTVEDENHNLVAKFQVDHYIPKDRYPCLGIALHNLYPVCASCNNKKGVKKVDFSLYATGLLTKESKSKFEIVDVDKTVAQYLIDRDSSKIKIAFTEPRASSGHYSLNSLFAIQGIYETQIDIVEELILKAVMYDDAYKAFLLASFKDLFQDRKFLDRLIVGNYVEAMETHNRPLSKFTQDIAKQLKLI